MSIKYVTRRELLISKQELLATQIAEIEKALSDLVEGRITNYVIGSMNVSRTASDLDKLRGLLKELENEFLANDNTLRGRSRRVVETQFYQSPTNIRYF